MFIYATPFDVWVKSLTKEEIEDYKYKFRDYDNPLLKAYCFVWGEDDEC